MGVILCWECAALAHYHFALRNSDGGGVEPCARPTSPPLPPQMEGEDDNDHGEDKDFIDRSPSPPLPPQMEEGDDNGSEDKDHIVR